MDLSPFIRLIKERCGLFINDHKQSTLSEAIHERMSAIGSGTQSTYFDTLLQNMDETLRLIDLLTNNETYFMREPQHFKLFTNTLFPQILQKSRQEHRKVKILSAGCSTGEEPYSVLISLINKYGESIVDSVEIIGFDINQSAVQSARSGIFKKHSFRNVGQDIRDQYFSCLPDGKHHIRDSIHGRVQFMVWNMMSTDHPAPLERADAIFYRNVSIYFDPEVQKYIFTRLSQFLNDNGYLFMSSAETFSHNIGPLLLTELDGIFLYQKKIEFCIDDRRNLHSTQQFSLNLNNLTPKRRFRDVPLHPQESPQPSQMGTQVSVDDHHLIFDNALACAKNKDNTTALGLLDTLIANVPSPSKALNLKAAILINLQRLDEARTLCLETLQADEWNLECYLLLGLIAKVSGDEQEALRRFKGAKYISPSCWLARMYLGDLYNAQGELEMALREYDLTTSLIKKHGKDQEVLSLFPLSFPLDQLIHLCEHNISTINQRLAAK